MAKKKRYEEELIIDSKILKVNPDEAEKLIKQEIDKAKKIIEEIDSGISLSESIDKKNKWKDFIENTILPHVFEGNAEIKRFKDARGSYAMNITAPDHERKVWIKKDIEAKVSILDNLINSLSFYSFATGQKEAIEKRITADIDKNYFFIAMSMSPKNDELRQVHKIFKLSVKSVNSNYTIDRVDDIQDDFRITEKILECIRKTNILICDLTEERPSVYYELGYARGMGKRVILTAKEGTELHFDIKDENVIFYKDSFNLEEKFTTRFSAMVK